MIDGNSPRIVQPGVPSADDDDLPPPGDGRRCADHDEGVPSADDDDLPPLPQPPNIRYLDRPVAVVPVWLRCGIMVALGVALASLGDMLMLDYERDHDRLAWLPRPDLAAPLQLVCDPACSAPTYCDSATGKCVADAAIAIDPTARRSGTVEHP